MLIMAEDRVQLKQEEIVGNEVVLSDINPKSNTKSIDDPTTGASLDKTLERMWQSINNKLSRIVNSVNGRTGVVVLDSSDVGLGNVDNVSFADIKQWVITRTAQEFGFKRLELFNSLRELDDTINHEWLHDEVYANKPFYSHHGYEANSVMDNRGYIGYIYYDSSVNRLKHTEMVLDTIGSADNSIIYNEQGHQNGETRDYSESGRIGVNIWTYEDALEVYNNISGNKADSGLRINKDNIAPKLYFFDGVYGDGATSLDPNALLYYAAEDIRQDEPNSVDIYIDGTKIEYNNSNKLGQDLYNNTNYIKQSFKVNDLILCNFNDENYLQPVGTGHDNDRVIDHEMNPLLMLKRPCIGQVTKAPTAQDPSVNYEIRFYSIRQNTYRGLKYDTVHTNASDYSNGALSVDLLATNNIQTKNQSQIYTDLLGKKQIGLSGINAMYPYNSTNMHATEGKSSKSKRVFRTILPSGLSDNIYRADATGLPNEQSSMYILPNYSLCVIPYIAFRNAVDPSHPSDNRYIPNWPATAPPLPIEPNYGFDDIDTNMLGINLVKGVSAEQGHGTYAVNLSGLRIDTDDFPIDNEWLGVDNSEHLPITTHSGGLSVNVGNFLEIGSSNGAYNVNKNPDYFYDEGKVNVRIDKMRGLHESYSNRLSVNISENIAPKDHDENHLSGGLKFTDDYGAEDTPQYGVLSVNTGGNARGLSIKNNTPCDVKYNISGNPIQVINESNVLSVQLYDLTREVSQSVSETTTPSGLEVKYGIFEEDIVPLLPNSNVYSKKVWRRVYDLDIELNMDPTQFSDDEVYIAAGLRWIVSTSELVYHPYVVFYSDKDQYDQVIDSIRSDPTIWPESKQCHVLIEDSSVPDVYTITGKSYCDVINLHLPDTDFDGMIRSDDASLVRRMTAIMAGSIPSIYVKKDTTTGGIEGFYSDPEKTIPFTIPATAVEGDLFATLNYVEEFNIPGDSELLYEIIYECYKPQGSNNLELRVYKPDGLESQAPDPWTESSFIELLRRSDADQNGRITTVDSTWILTFYTELQKEYRGMSLTDAWIAFLAAHGKTVGDDPIITVFSCRYEKGVRIKYDESRGITYSPILIEGTLIDETDRTVYDIDTLRANAKHDAISIKIADPSSGALTFDKYICGGLRFGTDGYLGVRINDSNKYNAALPSKNNGTQSDDLSIGTHGLHIYDQNILGVQLTEDGDLDNGELCFDRNGNLRISATFNPGKDNLTISGKLNGTTTNIPYNGSEPVTITLGPGLCFSEVT